LGQLPSKKRSRTRNQQDEGPVTLEKLYELLQPYLACDDPKPDLPALRGPDIRARCKQIVQLEGRGAGWRAVDDIAAGVTLQSDKPFAVVWGHQRDAIDSEADNADTALLIIEVARVMRKVGEVAWDLVTLLSPREEEAEKMLSEEPWICEDDALEKKVDAALEAVKFLSFEQRERVKLIVRHNMLGIYTNSEQLCHHTVYANLTGVALYIEPSYFNHSCTPNVARFNVGDVACFRTNRPVAAGEELCISYIESDCLCEPAPVRNELLGARDFMVYDGKACHGGNEEEDEEVDLPSVGPELQEELMQLDFSSRLESIEVIRQELSESSGRIIGTDDKELLLIEAVTYMQKNDYNAAVAKWEGCLDFAITKCPPNDESAVCFAVHAALAAIAAEDMAKATQHAGTALRVHQVAFGSGAALLKTRYEREVSEMAWGQLYGEELWKLLDATGS